jgi:hypothetical protein
LRKFVVSEHVGQKLTENDRAVNDARWHFVPFKAILSSNPNPISLLLKSTCPTSRSCSARNLPSDSGCDSPHSHHLSSSEHCPSEQTCFFRAYIHPSHFRKMSGIESQITEKFAPRIRSMLGFFLVLPITEIDGRLRWPSDGCSTGVEIINSLE